jgi:DNA-binding MarR family transcriptional regulator
MEKSFGKSISAIYRHLQIYINREFKKFGFGSGQYLFFIQIAKNDGICQKQLSHRLLIDKATTAKAIKKLLELGYIFSVQNKKDKRNFNLHLSEKGKEILPEVEKVLSGSTKILQQGLSSNEIDETGKLLNQMLNNITSKVDALRNINE